MPAVGGGTDLRVEEANKAAHEIYLQAQSPGVGYVHAHTTIIDQVHRPEGTAVFVGVGSSWDLGLWGVCRINGSPCRRLSFKK